MRSPRTPIKPTTDHSTDHRPSTWMRYLINGGSAATVCTVFFLYSNLGTNQHQPQRKEKRMPYRYCCKFMDDVIVSLLNIRQWIFGSGDPNDGRTTYRQNTYREKAYTTMRPERSYQSHGYWHQDTPREEDLPDLFTLFTTSSFYISLAISAVILFRLLTKHRMKTFMCAVTPPFIATFLQTSSSTATVTSTDSESSMTETTDRRRHSDDTDDLCRTHAYRVEEMAKAIEYLSKVNNQREREITKLSMKNDYLAESLARVYKYNRKMQDHMNNVTAEGSSSASTQLEIPKEDLRASTEKGKWKKSQPNIAESRDRHMLRAEDSCT